MNRKEILNKFESIECKKEDVQASEYAINELEKTTPKVSNQARTEEERKIDFLEGIEERYLESETLTKEEGELAKEILTKLNGTLTVRAEDILKFCIKATKYGKLNFKFDTKYKNTDDKEEEKNNINEIKIFAYIDGKFEEIRVKEIGTVEIEPVEKDLDSNFCTQTGKKLHDVCPRCWVKDYLPYNCGFDKCPGHNLLKIENESK